MMGSHKEEEREMVPSGWVDQCDWFYGGPESQETKPH